MLVYSSRLLLLHILPQVQRPKFRHATVSPGDKAFYFAVYMANHRFVGQTMDLHAQLHEVFFPALFTNRLLRESDYRNLPVFEPKRPNPFSWELALSYAGLSPCPSNLELQRQIIIALVGGQNTGAGVAVGAAGEVLGVG